MENENVAVEAVCDNQQQPQEEIKPQKKKRQSNLELLKIISMFLIVLSHSVPIYGSGGAAGFVDIYSSSFSLRNLGIYGFRYLAQIGCVVFFICSAWFLLDSKRVKGQKIISLLLDTLFFSLLYFAIYLLSGTKMTITFIKQSFFPMTFCSYWFITVYFLLYLMHPLLNMIIEKLSRKKLLALCIIIFIMFSAIVSIRRDAWLYSQAFGAMAIYFYVGYAKKYLNKACEKTKSNVIGLVVGAILSVILLVGLYFISTKNGDIQYTYNSFINITNPLIILTSFCLFNLFRKINVQSEFINQISSTTLTIYLFSENVLFYTLTKPQIFAWIYNNLGYNLLFVWIITFAILTFVVSVIVGLIYKYTIQKGTAKLSALLERGLEKGFNKIDKRFSDMN